jgi:hypothetical protein
MKEPKKKPEARSPKSEEVKGKRSKAKGTLKAKENNSAIDIPSLPAGTAHSDLKEPPTGPDSYRGSKLSQRNSLEQTENMEVHHHPEVEKKGIKEYLLEGLMIFVAVTMGFFAESLRETINEHDRAKEFAVTLYADLKADTVDLKSYIKYFDRGAKSVDTLMILLSANNPQQIPSGKLYWFGLWGGAYRMFAPHDATLIEMKNSGSLRYFSNHAINRGVAQYDQLCQKMKIYETNEQGIYIEVRKLRAQIFDFKYNEIANNITRIKNNNYQAAVDSLVKANPPLLSYDKVLFNQYIEMVSSRFLGRKVTMADTVLNHAVALIGTLKKEYSLDDE